MYLAVLFLGLLIIYPFMSHAQSLPGAADVGRIAPLERPFIAERNESKIIIPEITSDIAVPEAAKTVMIELQDVSLEGFSAFTADELAAFYEPYINRKVPLSTIWLIAGEITHHYQNAGYFLSRAYVPAQEVDNGRVIIKIVEGSLADVVLQEGNISADHSLITRLIQRITTKKPLSAYDLESFMLQLNALPGIAFRAVVEPIDGADSTGLARLSLHPRIEDGIGTLTVDNFGSRFLGPYQGMLTYQDSIIPLQQTTFSALSTLPTDELNYVALRHSIPVYPDWTVEFSGNYVTAEPGSTLEVNDIQSSSVELGVGVRWQPIRQRQENLIASLELTSQNSNGDILGNTPLTRDRIRALRANLRYDTADRFGGYNDLTLALNQGLSLFGASDAGERNISRIEAESDFTTAQLHYVRQQSLFDDFLAIGQFSSQLASGPLLSVEEFGYGGQRFGRAYDPSELTGDHGVAASIELRYLGLDGWYDITTTPYVFYDIGKVWNDDIGGMDLSGSSAGLGMRLLHDTGLSGNMGLAWPLTRQVGTPLYGDGKQPRLLMQLGYQW